MKQFSFLFFLLLRFREKNEQHGFSRGIIKWEASQWDLFPGAADDYVIYTGDGNYGTSQVKFNFVTCGLL